MLGNGLRAYERGSYGGWGGRQMTSTEGENFNFNMSDTSQQAMVSALSSPNAESAKSASAYPNFFPAAQRDFAARMKWTVTPKYADSNHEPMVRIEGPLTVLALPGETIKLSGYVSDPDKNQVSVKWWQFKVGTFTKDVVISNPTSLQPKITIPSDATPGQTIHLVLEATDNGKPALTRYQRVIITVRNK
jgi:hypothetical protein